MSNRPTVKEGDKVIVEDVNCVVSMVKDPNDGLGDLEVVFNPKKPTNHDVDWDGEKWVFSKRPDLGGYAENYPRLNKYVQILKQNHA